MNEKIITLIQILRRNELVKSVFETIDSNRASTKIKNILENEKLPSSEIIYRFRKIIDYIDNELLINSNNLKSLSFEDWELLNKETEYNRIKELIHDIRIEIREFLFDEEEIYIIAYLRVLLVLYVSLGYFTLDWCEQKFPISDTFYFREHQNYSYNLVPSIYRNLRYNGIIDNNYLSYLYIKNGFFYKYKKVFGGKIDLNYQFVTFMQHSTAYSPLLDFTDKLTIAEVFATSPGNSNINIYNNTDAALFVFYPNRKNNDCFDFSKHCVQFYDKKLNLESTIFGKKLLFCDIDDFEVEFDFSTISTNDRMKYQHGSFMYINKCVIANGQLFFPFSQGYFIKYRIYAHSNLPKHKKNVPSKKDVYNRIVESEPYHDERHLMDPYLYFTEYTN